MQPSEANEDRKVNSTEKHFIRENDTDSEEHKLQTTASVTILTSTGSSELSFRFIVG